LRANLSFGRDAVRASDFVLDIIENGYKILFQKSPLPYSIENRSSALLHRGFVREVLPELLTRGCIKQLSVYPPFCSPLDEPTQKFVFLETVLDFEKGLILIRDCRILKLKSSLFSCLQKVQ
ncbi:unnamed protein product, partial [Porites lobata]